MSTSAGKPLRYASPSTEVDAAGAIAALRSRLRAHGRRDLNDCGARRAAVLVPLHLDENGRLALLCFERTHDVLEHKGEICLPGGSVEAKDRSVTDAALREAHEELGIEPASVDVLGLLDDVHTTVSNYVITPVVGYIAVPRPVVVDALEVARPIAVTIDDLLQSGVERFELRGAGGSVRTIYAYHIGADRIWGATARILHGLLNLWFGAGEEVS